MRSARHLWGLLQGHRTDGLDSATVWVYRSRIGRRKFGIHIEQHFDWCSFRHIRQIYIFRVKWKCKTRFNSNYDECKFIVIIRRIWVFQQLQNRVHKILVGLDIHKRTRLLKGPMGGLQTKLPFTQGRVTLPNRMSFRKVPREGGGGSVSIQKFIFQVLDFYQG